MNLNFHYFTVKALAFEAGFEENEAQFIANFSQFIDDYDKERDLCCKKEEVPDFAKYLISGEIFGYAFVSPVTTGFVSWFDMVLLMLKARQKWIVTPFHFIPVKCIKDLPNKDDWRVQVARMDTPSLITGLLANARTQFLSGDAANRHKNLLRIAMLLHTFADTYAHQSFMGYEHWSNETCLSSVTDDCTQENITDKYEPKEYKLLPHVGHVNLNSAPDESGVRYQWYAKKAADKEEYALTGRDNSLTYIDASKEILNYLRSCLGKPPIDEKDWRQLQLRIHKGSLISTNPIDITALEDHWTAIFPETTFHYSSNEVLKTLITGQKEIPHPKKENEALTVSALTNDFFLYNVLADETRVAVNGERKAAEIAVADA
ncbi:MAG: hypothetical protein LBB79_02080 [Prevotellaceae bacterium]|jgi:hypothetical protein|nr:hypothetical protein [Prevotellaceae bacterium]